MTRNLKLGLVFTLILAVAGATCLPLTHRRVDAQGGRAAQLMSRGDVKINGNPAAGNMAVASGSRITTGKAGYAVLSVADAGQFYLGDNSEIVVNFLADRTRVEVVSGIVRCIKSQGALVQVFSTRCTHIDVIKGSIPVYGGPEQSAPAVESIAEAQSKDYPESAYIRFDSTGLDDFRVAVFECAVSASPSLPPIVPVVPVVGATTAVIATVVGAAVAASIVPVVSQDDAPLSPVRP
ncbi:MAG: hypothetical protein SNJ67_09720 [Chloracidobacterium sp.]|uniref:FecR protein domain-containing protein n=1 Tax=Chloracidobacterium validum TaxID=2821543 RepID=A0ABX8BDX6_9BACT|nr:hypothetical protein [Chloracidobacterium validum]QUW04075.1 hypothetical protein J8C06_13560 [Chloracidobacterium validum]